MSTNDLTDKRKWLGATLAAALTGVVWLAAQGPQEGSGLTFTTVSDPTLFPQTLMATTGNIADPQYGILGGIAFAPDGDVWSAECVFSGTRLHRFDMQQWVAVDPDASPVTYVHPEVATLDYGPFYVPGVDPAPTGKGGCGLVNHPDGYMYSNSAAGIWRFDPATGLPVPLPGQPQATAGLVNTRPGSGLGMAVDPKADAGYHAVYVGSDCHYQTNVGEDTCTIYDFDPAATDPQDATKVFARVHTSMVEMIDGLYFDPSGNYLFGAQRGPFNALLIFARPEALKPLDAPADDSQIVRQVPMTSEPDGVAFHVADQNNGPFVVTLNESYDGDLAGTMTRFDFPNNGDYTTEPTQSTFASGGFRGDLLTVGGDGCIYGTQGLLYSVGGLYGTRFNDTTTSANNSIFKMCGGFAPPPGVSSPQVGSLSGYAYVDVNRDGAKQAGEPGIPGVTITVANGGTEVTDGTGHYSFANLQADTYSVSAPDPAANKHLFTASPIDAAVALGADTPDINFGYVPGQISGFAFVDTNRDQVRQLNETGIGGVTITLSNGGTPVTVITASDGGYSFPDLDANSYHVSAPSTAAGKVIDTAPAIPIALPPGENRPDVNFGYVPGGLSGFAYVDANRNGVKDAGEAGISGVVITGPSGTTTTAADGSYSFDGLDAGTHSVSAPTTANAKALFTASPLSVTIEAGATSANNNFGYVTGELSGFAYVDVNRNSAKDAGEAGIANVTITGPSGATTTTAADGSYSFSSLDGGTYSVSAPSTASGKALFTASPLSVDLAAGASSANNNFGYVTGSISGFAYNDANGNGVRDSGEAGIGNVTITLSGPVGATTATAGDGSYAFAGLNAGTYSVSAPATAAGLSLDTASPLSVVLASGGTQPNVNFGYNNGVNGPTSACTGMIGDFVWVDLNRNGIQDAGEPGLSTPISLKNAQGATVATTTSDANGQYHFTAVCAGSYVVTATIPAGYDQTGTAVGTNRAIDSNGTPASVTLTTDSSTEQTIDFGFVNGFCEKQPVQTELNPTGSHFPANKGPDVIVRVHKGQSVQAAIDQAADLNGDGYIIVAVVAKDGGVLGGSVTEQVVISGAYTKPFAIIGCSVTLTDPTPGDGNPTARVRSSASAPPDGIGARIFVMDVHAEGSAVAGWLVEGDYRFLRNVYGKNNGGIGVKFVGNSNTMHNGNVSGNQGVGLSVQGNSNTVTDTDAFSNLGDGVSVTGNSNQILKVDAGDMSKGNGGDGVHVEGAGNLIQEAAAFANSGDGIEVVASSGSPNILKKNVVGDRSGKGNTGNGIAVSGPGNGTATPIELEQNTLKANGLAGIKITGTGHQLKNNVSGGTGSGETNVGCEFDVVSGNFNATGNKANGTTVAGSNGSAFPSSCIGQ